jgi:hypothetical protein
MQLILRFNEIFFEKFGTQQKKKASNMNVDSNKSWLWL